MIPLADLHCHLLAGLDDGPRSMEDAVAMCRIAANEGVAFATALAHQNDRYPDVTPERICRAAELLSKTLREEGVPLVVYPSSEVMVHPEIVDSWKQGKLLSIANRRQYVLLEMPHGLFVDLREIVEELCQHGVRPILAHPERQEELLHEPGRIEELILCGCLVQVSTHNVTDPPSRRDARALRGWFRRGVVHVLGSDGHSPNRRPPRMAEAYRRIVEWAGAGVADRVASTNGMAVLQGLPLRIAPPERASRRWLSLLFS